MPGIKDLKGKVTVITGAGSGIGRASAILFAKEGARLVISDIHEDRLETVQKEIKNMGAEVISKVTDVSDIKQISALSSLVLDTFGRVDILHNNAGIGWGGPSELFPVSDFEKVLSVNLLSVVYGINSFLPQMIKQKSGHIVNTASGAGLIPIVPLGAYTASKFAVVGYSEVLRAELRRHNIGVTAICPGVINTNIVQDGKSTLLEGAKTTQDMMVDFYKKYGWSPDRVAKAVIKGVKKNKGIVPVGPEVWVLWYLKRMSQTVSELFSRISAKTALR
ncbi:MAG: SDR family NAD(P)-dependent oxidoreductase [Proteobacteria bacterium]|nr:SDR family NAD(P)-dependent oxidoreductase [Pseudomonadota bacterium]